MLQATGVVLAGGKSSRMGTDKALLLLDNQTLLERSVKKLQEIFAEVVIVDNKEEKYSLPNVKEVSDIYKDCGPLGGIHAALTNSTYDRIFVVACDLPFWGNKLAQLLLKSCRGYDAAVPHIGPYFEPLLAVYKKNCLPAIEDCLDRRFYKVTGFYPMVKINYIKRVILGTVCQPETTFFNINTIEDLHKICYPHLTFEDLKLSLFPELSHHPRING